MRYLDFENPKYEKGFKEFKLTTENIKNNIGKKIVFVTSRDIDKVRGYVFPRYRTIFGIKGKRILVNDGHDDILISDILECGIQIEN